MTTADRLVTFDNNILIDLRKNNKPTATYARQLLVFNQEGKITVATTLSTMLEKQRTGEEMSLQELSYGFKKSVSPANTTLWGRAQLHLTYKA